jgi:hypothetical protein
LEILGQVPVLASKHSSVRGMACLAFIPEFIQVFIISNTLIVYFTENEYFKKNIIKNKVIKF